MQSLFLRTLVDDLRIEPGDRILSALSGGADSVALLELLLEVAERLQIEVHAAHLDHAMRPESAEDVIFVRELCRQRGVPLVVERREVPARAAARGQNLEEAARDERRDFLLQVAARHGCRFVALGHHRDDQAETLLQRLLRGCGVTGLAGMRPQSGKIVRPLLSFSREQLVRYLDARGVAYRDDPSNADVRFTRNRLRHQLLPALRTYNPRIDEHLARLSRRIAQEEDYWDLQVAERLRALATNDRHGLWLPVEALNNLHPALRARVLRAALQRVRGDLRHVGAVHIEALEGLLAGVRPEAQVDLPGGWAARRYRRLWLRQAAPPPVADFALEIPGVGTYPLPGGGWLQVGLHSRCAGEGRGRAEFDAKAVSFPLMVRNRRAGDRFFPSGAPGHRKLKDFFIDLKLDRELRRSWPLVVGDEILWLPGLRRCDGGRPQGDDGPVLRLTVTGVASAATPLNRVSD